MPRPAGIINCEATSLVGAFAPIIQIAMLVQHPWEYVFSSARNYADMDHLLDVIRIY